MKVHLSAMQEDSFPLGTLSRMSGSALYHLLFQFSPIAILEEDWSAAKQAVDAIKAAGVQNFEEYLKIHPEIIGLVRREHRVVDANDAAIRLFGYSSKIEFLRRTRELLPANVPSNSRVLCAFANGDRSGEGERLLCIGDNKFIPILWRAVIPPPDGDFSSVLFFAVDISARKKAEEELSASQAELGRMSRIAAIGEMAGSIAHEINQPLGAIRLLADGARNWLNRNEPDVLQARRSLGDIGVNADRASVIVERVKELVSNEPSVFEPCSIKESVTNAFWLVELEARQAGISLIMEIAKNLPLVQAEHAQLRQVLVNLLTNALEAMAATDAPQKAVRVSAFSEGTKAIRVLVEDDGQGIDPSIQTRIFESFFSTKHRHAGLGLSICRSIVAAHGGSIEGTNREKGGARFAFTLPSL